MSDGTKISWADATWSPVVGCTKVSAGCDNCYAIRTAHRMTANPNPLVSQAYAGTEAGGEWTGKVNLLAGRLDQPLRWRKPRRIFVNAQSDLFHKDVPDSFIGAVFDIMSKAPHHTFQILTKRHGRMRALLNRWATQVPDDLPQYKAAFRSHGGQWSMVRQWPLPNVWLGVSVEDQATADLRIPALLDTPAAVRWISAEPLLGPVDLREWVHTPECLSDDDDGPPWCTCGLFLSGGLGWVVVGGESGPGARPMHPAWARSLRDQCASAGVAFHFKQWGEHGQDGRRVGKRAAGDLLDGVRHHEWPATP